MNIEDLKKFKKYNPDLKIRELKNGNTTVYIIYFETLCKSNTINDFILKPIYDDKIKSLDDIKNKLPSGNLLEINDENTLYDNLYSGFTIISIDNKFISFETKESLDSGIVAATNEKVIKGPKDAFTENYQSNVGLIRKRIRSKNLKVNEYTIGTSSKTKVALFYLDDIVNKDLVNKIEKKLKTMSLDYVANSNYIIDAMSKKNNIMPTNIMTERPDLTSFLLMEGRIAIMVENSPQVIIIPMFFSDTIHTIDDYYQNSKNVSVTRIIRVIAFIISVTIPGMYLALTTFNQEALPTSLLINFSIQRQGVPFPSIVEALVMFLIFEILKESDTRIPFVVGTSMSIVGALVLGQAAVSAGIVSPILIIIVAITGIASFAIPDFSFGFHLRYFRFAFILFGFMAGFLGISLGLFIYISLLCSIKSFGVSFMSPFAPASNSKGNGYLLEPIWKREFRAPYMAPKSPKDQEKISMKWKYNNKTN